MLEAKDHRAVDKFIPFFAMFVDRFCGVSFSTSIFTSYPEITMIIFKRNRDPTWNARDIRELRSKIVRFKEEVKHAYGKYQSSEMGTPKFHMMDHVCDDVERMGGLQYSDASYFERAHVSLKERFRDSSRRKRTGMDEMIGNFQKKMVRMEERNSWEGEIGRKEGSKVRNLRT